MASTSETGHAKNVANFETLISFCSGYGASFNPSKAAIKLPALNTLLTDAKTSLTAINTALPASTNAVNAREIVFAPLRTLATKIVNAVDASDVPKQVVKDVKSIARKLQGRRATPKAATVVDDPNTPEDESKKSNSASQMSYDNRIENMEKLIQLLSSQPGYAPNETELQVASLNTLLADMQAKNTAAINALTPVSNARIARNNLLYKKGTGLIDIAGEVKKYVKSVFGASSPQYKQVGGLKFNPVGK